MNHRERFHALMRFESVDRLPHVEWASWWDKTIDRWRGEGLRDYLTDPFDIRVYLGLDPYRQHWLPIHRPGFPAPPAHGLGVIADMSDYERVRPFLYPEAEECIDFEALRKTAERQARGEEVVWLTLNGYFWFPRTLLGIQQHFMAFYEQPETMRAINDDLVAHSRRMLDAFCEVCVPDFITFAEDMTYNHGAMISEDLFDAFMAPYYRQLTPVLRERGIYGIIDSDGEIAPIIPWFLGVGIDGFLPLERQAGCDIAAYRDQYPKARFIGAFDKMVMKEGEAAMRTEFERLLPVMRQGGYIPSVDHQTPPDVSLETYGVYVRLLKEYCAK